MNSPVATGIRPVPLPWKFLLALFGFVFALQLVTYWRAFTVKPAGDDFGPPLFDIFIGNEKGPLSFYLESDHGFSYRPTQSLLMWAFGSIQPDNPIPWIHSLNFIGWAIVLLATMLWIRELPISRLGAAVTALVLCFHPTLVTPLGSLDGFATPWVSGLIWLTTWVVYRYRHQPWLNAALVTLLFIFAVGFKEFAFAMAPLACVVMLFFCRSHRLTATIVAGAWITLLAGVYMLIRQAVLPPPEARPAVDSRILSSIHDLAGNLAAYAGGIFFTGNSVWVFVNQNAAILGLVGLWILTCFSLIASGLIWRLRSTASNSSPPDKRTIRTWIAFFLLCLPAASFPASITNHISEMYVTPVLFPVAILTGIAADGIRNASRRTRAISSVLGLILLSGAIVSIQFKLILLQQVGEKADVVLKAALRHIPVVARHAHVALLFPKSDNLPRPTYSVYRVPNVDLLQEVAPDWLRRQDNIRFALLEVDSINDFQWRPEYDLALLWNEASQQFIEVGSADSTQKLLQDPSN